MKIAFLYCIEHPDLGCTIQYTIQNIIKESPPKP